MDNKFDQSIKEAQETYEPKPDFVANTINQLPSNIPKKHWGIKLWAPALVGTLAVLAIIFVAVPIGDHKTASKSTLLTTSTKTPASATTSSTSNNTTVASATPASTDNTSLQNDINGVQSSINQENTDQASATSTINDSQQEITVPTD